MTYNLTFISRETSVQTSPCGSYLFYMQQAVQEQLQLTAPSIRSHWYPHERGLPESKCCGQREYRKTHCPSVSASPLHAPAATPNTPLCAAPSPHTSPGISRWKWSCHGKHDFHCDRPPASVCCCHGNRRVCTGGHSCAKVFKWII